MSAARKFGGIVSTRSSSFFYALVIFGPRGFLIFVKLQFSLKHYLVILVSMLALSRSSVSSAACMLI